MAYCRVRNCKELVFSEDLFVENSLGYINHLEQDLLMIVNDVVLLLKLHEILQLGVLSLARQRRVLDNLKAHWLENLLVQQVDFSEVE